MRWPGAGRERRPRARHLSDALALRPVPSTCAAGKSAIWNSRALRGSWRPTPAGQRHATTHAPPGNIRRSRPGRCGGYVTLKLLVLVAVPAAVVAEMGPVCAPAGTV